MSGQKSPEEMFPNLFGKKPVAKRNVREMKPADMRLLQYMMRQASRRAPQPAPLGLPRPAASQRRLGVSPQARPQR